MAMISRPSRLSMTISMYVRQARKHGFTDSDIKWVLYETKKDYLIESRKPGLHPCLMLDILKKKVRSMAIARRIVKETCEELGIKTKI